MLLSYTSGPAPHPPSLPIEINPATLALLNLIIATMIYGVSLSLRPADFCALLQTPRAAGVGLLTQFIALPALTCLATILLWVEADLALAMILVACLPGGNFSNILTWLGRGNVSLSISLTAVGSLLALLLTPVNFAFYGMLNPSTRELLTAIAVEPLAFLGLLSLVLGLPLGLGMLTTHYAPDFALRLQRRMKLASVTTLTLFVGIAFATHWEPAQIQGPRIALLATAHNVAALALGGTAAWLARLTPADRRALTMEVGVQNTGLGLLLLFNFYPDAAGMIVLTAFWGVPHLITGLGLVWWWNRRSPL